MPVATGAFGARLAYGLETGFGTGGTANKSFGFDAKLTTIEIRNNMERVYVIGSRLPVALVAKRFEGAWGVDSILTFDGSRPDWVDAIIKSDNTAATLLIEAGFTGNTRVLRTLRGCVVTRASIEVRQNEVARYRLDGMYSTETVSNPTSISPVTTSGVPLTFVEGKVFIGGTEVLMVESASVDITTGNEVVWTLGSRMARDYYYRAMEVDCRFTAYARDDDFVRRALNMNMSTGSTTPVDSSIVGSTANIELRFQPATGRSSVTGVLTISMSGVINEISHAIEAMEPIMYDVRFLGTNFSIATSST